MDTKFLKLFFSLLASVAILSSCGSDSDSDDDFDVKDLHGLWEANFLPGCEDEEEECEPSWTHVFFDKDQETAFFLTYMGGLAVEKMAQAEVLEPAGCYYVTDEETWEIDGDELIISDSEEEGDSEFEIELEDGVLTLDDGEDEYELEFISNDLADEEICSMES